MIKQINFQIFKILILSFILSITFSTVASASIYSSQFLSLDSISKYPDSTYYFGVFRFETIDYFTNLPEESYLSKQQYFSTRLGVSGSSSEKTLGYGADMQAGKFNFGTSNYSVQELYASFQVDNNLKVVGGRKKYQWSALDSYWKTGLWQPKYAIDYLRPEEQGLTGFFLEYQKPDFQFVSFTTPAFIPNMGVEVREEGGELTSDSRWFRKPTNKYDLNGRIKSLTYSLSVPETRELVSKPGAGMSMVIGNRNQGWFTNLSVGYKPVNELILKRQGYALTDEKVVSVVVSPDVTYHSIMSTDVGYSFNNFRIIFSYLEDNPKEKTPDPEWSIQKLGGIKAYSVMTENSLDSEMIQNLKFQVGLLKVYGGTIEDIDSQSNKDSFTLFEERVNFYNATLLKTQGQFFKIFGKPVITRLSYLRDFDQMGSLVNTELQLYPIKNWAILFGGDFISVDKTENNTSSGFLNQYRANDRVYSGVNYVF